MPCVCPRADNPLRGIALSLLADDGVRHRPEAAKFRRRQRDSAMPRSGLFGLGGQSRASPLHQAVIRRVSSEGVLSIG